MVTLLTLLTRLTLLTPITLLTSLLLSLEKEDDLMGEPSSVITHQLSVIAHQL